VPIGRLRVGVIDDSRPEPAADVADGPRDPRRHRNPLREFTQPLTEDEQIAAVCPDFRRSQAHEGLIDGV